MFYRVKNEKLRSALSSNSQISDIEKYLIQEGLKQILLSTGTLAESINESLKFFLIEHGVIEIVSSKSDIEIIDVPKNEKEREGLRIAPGSTHFFPKGICELNITTSLTDFKVITNSDIFYRDKKIVDRGEKIPYYTVLKTWSDTNDKRIIIDLRSADFYESDFNSNFLNNTGVFDTVNSSWGKCEFYISIVEVVE